MILYSYMVCVYKAGYNGRAHWALVGENRNKYMNGRKPSTKTWPTPRGCTEHKEANHLLTDRDSADDI